MSKRGIQKLWKMELTDSPLDQTRPGRSTEFAKVITLWIPRQFVMTNGVDVLGFLADVNEKIIRRGFILWDGQLLTAPITDVTVGPGVVVPEVVPIQGRTYAKEIRVGEHAAIIFEHGSSDTLFDVPALRDWQVPQRDFFQLEQPYQMAEDGTEYTYSHLMTRIVGPFLAEEERIAAILHGGKDDCYFYCTCHQAEVVYTTRHRLLCMGCGAIHVVLREALPLQSKRLLTPEEWLEYFADDGPLLDEQIDLSLVDFRDIENAEAIWTTDQWEEAKHRFVFFARSSPEEIAEAIRGTEADSSIFLEAGWTPVETSPPPAHQVEEDSIDVDLVENASHALRDGVASFLSARKNSERLVTALPQLFKAIELLLKARLKELEAHGLDDHPNNPTVLKRLETKGVNITNDESEALARLRRLRNDLQHGVARFNHRNGLALSRRSLVFLDRFSRDELGLWIGDAIPPDDWYEMLQISEIASRAREVVKTRLDEVRRHPEATVSLCARCGEDAMIRPHPATGATCLLCGYVPIESPKDLGHSSD